MVIKQILNFYHLTQAGNAVSPKEGRIAKNIIIGTKEKGSVLIRSYPTDFDAKRVLFEVSILNFLVKKRIDVPSPICGENGEFLTNNKGELIFVYQLLPGESLKLDELDGESVRQASIMLKNLIDAVSAYIPDQDAPTGDLEFIYGILFELSKKHPEIGKNSTIKEMLELVSNHQFSETLRKLPQGIVHADYFFENVLKNNGRLAGIIDFGDAYYGCLLMDIVIGAMEFAFKTEENFEINLFKVFLEPHADWLASNNITFQMFMDVLLANIARFTAHTLNLFLVNDKDLTTFNISDVVEENTYLNRYRYFKRNDTRTSLSRTYAEVLDDVKNPNDRKLNFSPE